MQGTCEIEGCTNRVRTRGLCVRHYHRLLRYGDAQGGSAERMRGIKVCIVDDCERPTLAHGMCNRHYKRWKSYGDPLAGANDRCIICEKPVPHSSRRYCSDECKAEGMRRSSRKAALRYYHADSDRASATNRRRHLREKFGLDPDSYDAMLERQGGACAICRESCPSGRRLAVDHDHEAGRIRGLLCMNCNQGLGKFFDQPERLLAAAKYLTV